MRHHRNWPLLAALAAAVAGAPSAAAAPGGYGPTAGDPAFAAGTADVVAARTFTSVGGTIAGRIPGARVELLVPAGALADGVQLGLLRIRFGTVSTVLRRQGVRGRILAAVGITGITPTGQVVRGRLTAGLVTLRLSRRLGRGAAIYVWDPVRRRFERARTPQLTRTATGVSIGVRRPTEVVVVAPRA